MKKIISVFVVICLAMCLSGCTDTYALDTTKPNINTASSSEEAYAYIYTPDGTLIAEGFPDYCVSNYGVATIILDGIRYMTDYSNVLVVFRQPAQ